MKTLLVAILLSWNVSAQIVPVASEKLQFTEMTITDLQFVAGVLASYKVHPRINCEISFKEIRENRKFSTGHKWIEMLEIKLKRAVLSTEEVTAYFPVGGKIAKSIVNSSLTGPAEQIVLKADDKLEHQLSFQHDGRGQIVYLEMHSLNRVYPCQVK